MVKAIFSSFWHYFTAGIAALAVIAVVGVWYEGVSR